MHSSSKLFKQYIIALRAQ